MLLMSSMYSMLRVLSMMMPLLLIWVMMAYAAVAVDDYVTVAVCSECT